MKFESIAMCHRNQIDEIRRNYGHSLSSHAFSSLYLWKDKLKLSIHLSERSFCVKCEEHGMVDYFFPCGDEEEKRKLILQLMEKGAVSFRYITGEDRLFLERYFPGYFRFKIAREDWEYIYRKDDQVRLEGSYFKSLRAKVHRGEHAHQWTVQKLSKETAALAAEVTRRWNEEMKHNGESADINATLNALNHFDELGLSGVLLQNEQTPLAFALGTIITKDTFDLHISKTLEKDIDYYLKWELFRQLPDDILYINREEDLGIEGLRIHKTQMKPFRFNELWKGWTELE